ncbi:MAG: diacylglycerol kinase family lipid kinase [Candidatus Cloacimonetes bacterium]|nr:diacylglycerol kinase family lipid kinase [Candidatus Cloacimonadota bacterium]
MFNRPKKSWLFIVNALAGRGKTGRKLGKLVEQLNRFDFDFEIEITKYPKHAIELTREYIRKGYRKLVAVGGDGTVNEVVNGIMLSRREEDVILGIIPEGGGNDFARNFRISGNIEKDLEILKKEVTIPVDVGKIEEQYFINALGLGFDAEVAQHADKIRYLNGLPRYLLAVMKALVKLKPHKMEITLNGEQFDISVLLISIGNGLSTGGGFLLTPHAKVDDGRFDICLIKKIKLLRLLQLLPTAISGKHLEQPEVEIRQTDRIEVKTSQVLPIYYDGELPELTNPLHFTIDLLPRRINLICTKR